MQDLIDYVTFAQTCQGNAVPTKGLRGIEPGLGDGVSGLTEINAIDDVDSWRRHQANWMVATGALSDFVCCSGPQPAS